MPHKVMIVEDEMIIALELSKSLKKMGYEVPAIVNNGSKAVDIVEDLTPDLIMMDVNIPGEFNGIEAGEIINKVYDIPIIYCTAYSEEEIRKKISTFSNAGYLLKPYDDDILLEKIQSLLELGQNS